MKTSKTKSGSIKFVVKAFQGLKTSKTKSLCSGGGNKKRHARLKTSKTKRVSQFSSSV